MKRHFPLRILALSFSVALLLPGAVAQEAPQPPLPGPRPIVRPLPPAKEPFLRERGAPNTAPDASGSVTSVTLVYELFSLPTEDLPTLLAEASEPGARYRRINDLVKLGRAKLELVQAASTRSGFRTSLESNDGAQVPNEYLRSATGQVAVSNLPMYVGDRVEMEASLTPDSRSCNLNVMVDAGQWLGFRKYQPEPPQGPTMMGLLTEKRSIVTSLAVRTGDPVLLGTLSRPPFSPDTAKQAVVVFVKIGVNRDRPENSAPAVGPVSYNEQTLWYYSLDRAAAREILAGENKPGAYFAAVKALTEKQLARLEHTMFLPSQNGVRAKSDENIVGRQPGFTVFENPVRVTSGQNRPGDVLITTAPNAAGNMSTKMPGANVGISVEMQSEIGPADALIKGVPLTAELYLSINWRKENGNVTVAGQDVSTLAQEGRRIETMLPCYPGVPTFISTLNSPRETGMNDRKDDGRTWLVFVQVTPVRP